MNHLGILVAVVFLVGGEAACTGTCAAGCVPTVVFQLKSPVAGRTVDVEFRNQAGATIAGLECQTNDASVSCPNTLSGSSVVLDPRFDDQGMLTSVTWIEPPPGLIEVIVISDGATVLDESVTYVQRTEPGPCGTCGQATTLLVGS
jgi:hypothetical protein